MTVLTGNLPELWELVIDTCSGFPTELQDPEKYLTEWESVAFDTGLDSVTATLTPSSGPAIDAACPRPEPTWPDLMAVLRDERWRRAIVPRAPDNQNTIAPEAADLMQHPTLGGWNRHRVLQDCWPDLDWEFQAVTWLFFEAGDPEEDYCWLELKGFRARTYQWEPSFGTGTNAMIAIPSCEAAIDVWGYWQARTRNDLGTFRSNITPSSDTEPLMSALQFQGKGADVNALELETLHIYAERMAASAQNGALATRKGRPLLTVQGASVTLPPRQYTLDSVMERLALATKSFAGVSVQLHSQKTDAVVIPADGVLIRKNPEESR